MKQSVDATDLKEADYSDAVSSIANSRNTETVARLKPTLKIHLNEFGQVRLRTAEWTTLMTSQVKDSRTDDTDDKSG